MTDVDLEAEAKADEAKTPRCADFDEDCDDIPNKVMCYLYDPFKGYCPYLSVKE